MLQRFAHIAAPLLLVLTAAAPAPPADAVPAPSAQAPARVAIVTELGTITAELETVNAPITSANFLRYAAQKRFDGTVFYRAMRLDWGDQPNGLIQAGTRNDPKRVLPAIAHEPTSATGVRHKAGTLSMARFAPGTATGDFSILLSDMPGLDADPASTDPEAAAGYSAFGRVIEGMDLVRRIFDAPLSMTKGEGVMRGQMLEAPVRIVSVRKVAVPAAGATAAGPEAR